MTRSLWMRPLLAGLALVVVGIAACTTPTEYDVEVGQRVRIEAEVDVQMEDGRHGVVWPENTFRTNSGDHCLVESDRLLTIERVDAQPAQRPAPDHPTRDGACDRKARRQEEGGGPR